MKKKSYRKCTEAYQKKLFEAILDRESFVF